MLILRKERPHRISNFVKDLALSSIKVGLIFEWIKYIAVEKTLIFLIIRTGYVIIRIVFLNLHVCFRLIYICSGRRLWWHEFGCWFLVIAQERWALFDFEFVIVIEIIRIWLELNHDVVRVKQLGAFLFRVQINEVIWFGFRLGKRVIVEGRCGRNIDTRHCFNNYSNLINS